MKRNTSKFTAVFLATVFSATSALPAASVTYALDSIKENTVSSMQNPDAAGSTEKVDTSEAETDKTDSDKNSEQQELASESDAAVPEKTDNTVQNNSNADSKYEVITSIDMTEGDQRTVDNDRVKWSKNLELKPAKNTRQFVTLKYNVIVNSNSDNKISRNNICVRISKNLFKSWDDNDKVNLAYNFLQGIFNAQNIGTSGSNFIGDYNSENYNTGRPDFGDDVIRKGETQKDNSRIEYEDKGDGYFYFYPISKDSSKNIEFNFKVAFAFSPNLLKMENKKYEVNPEMEVFLKDSSSGEYKKVEDKKQDDAYTVTVENQINENQIEFDVKNEKILANHGIFYAWDNKLFGENETESNDRNSIYIVWYVDIKRHAGNPDDTVPFTYRLNESDDSTPGKIVGAKFINVADRNVIEKNNDYRNISVNHENPSVYTELSFGSDRNTELKSTEVFDLTDKSSKTKNLTGNEVSHIPGIAYKDRAQNPVNDYKLTGLNSFTGRDYERIAVLKKYNVEELKKIGIDIGKEGKNTINQGFVLTKEYQDNREYKNTSYNRGSIDVINIKGENRIEKRNEEEDKVKTVSGVLGLMKEGYDTTLNSYVYPNSGMTGFTSFVTKFTGINNVPAPDSDGNVKLEKYKAEITEGDYYVSDAIFENTSFKDMTSKDNVLKLDTKNDVYYNAVMFDLTAKDLKIGSGNQAVEFPDTDTKERKVTVFIKEKGSDKYKPYCSVKINIHSKRKKYGVNDVEFLGDYSSQNSNKADFVNTKLSESKNPSVRLPENTTGLQYVYDTDDYTYNLSAYSTVTLRGNAYKKIESKFGDKDRLYVYSDSNSTADYNSDGKADSKNSTDGMFLEGNPIMIDKNLLTHVGSIDSVVKDENTDVKVHFENSGKNMSHENRKYLNSYLADSQYKDGYIYILLPENLTENDISDKGIDIKNTYVLDGKNTESSVTNVSEKSFRTGEFTYDGKKRKYIKVSYKSDTLFKDDVNGVVTKNMMDISFSIKSADFNLEKLEDKHILVCYKPEDKFIDHIKSVNTGNKSDNEFIKSEFPGDSFKNISYVSGDLKYFNKIVNSSKTEFKSGGSEKDGTYFFKKKVNNDEYKIKYRKIDPDNSKANSFSEEIYYQIADQNVSRCRSYVITGKNIYKDSYGSYYKTDNNWNAKIKSINFEGDDNSRYAVKGYYILEDTPENRDKLTADSLKYTENPDAAWKYTPVKEDVKKIDLSGKNVLAAALEFEKKGSDAGIKENYFKYSMEYSIPVSKNGGSDINEKFENSNIFKPSLIYTTLAQSGKDVLRDGMVLIPYSEYLTNSVQSGEGDNALYYPSIDNNSFVSSDKVFPYFRNFVATEKTYDSSFADKLKDEEFIKNYRGAVPVDITKENRVPFRLTYYNMIENKSDGNNVTVKDTIDSNLDFNVETDGENKGKVKTELTYYTENNVKNRKTLYISPEGKTLKIDIGTLSDDIGSVDISFDTHATDEMINSLRNKGKKTETGIVGNYAETINDTIRISSNYSYAALTDNNKPEQIKLTYRIEKDDTYGYPVDKDGKEISLMKDELKDSSNVRYVSSTVDAYSEQTLMKVPETASFEYAVKDGKQVKGKWSYENDKAENFWNVDSDGKYRIEGQNLYTENSDITLSRKLKFTPDKDDSDKENPDKENPDKDKTDKEKPDKNKPGGGHSHNNDKNDSKRIDGEDRIDTSVKISKEFYNRADVVIVCRHDLFPDSLTSTVLSKLLNAPILLTHTDKLDEKVKDEISRLKATHVIIVGGPDSVSEHVKEEIRDLFDKNVERISGVDRYGTSEMVARRVIGITGKKDKAVVASGEVFPDALSVSPFAAHNGYPILLVRKEVIPYQIERGIKDLSIETTYVAGGVNTISENTYGKLPKPLERMAGEDRYETALAIAKSKFKDADKSFVASGEVFSDALVIGPVAGKYNDPLVLVKKNPPMENVKKYIESSKIDFIYIIGGKNTISTAMEDYIKR